MRNLRVLPFVVLVVCASVVQAQQKVVFLRFEKMLPDEFSDNDPANAWVANLDGSNQVKITSSRWVSHARWLNEKTVVVISEGDIWLVPLDGRAKTRLTKGEYIKSLDCSRDGQMIFFTKGSPDVVGSLIFQMDCDGKNRQRLTETHEGFMPLIAMSRNRLFCLDDSEEKTRIKSLSAVDGKEEVIFQALGGSSSIFSLACDKEGEKVVFSLIYHDPDLKAQLIIVNVSTGQSSELCKIDSGGSYGCSFIGDDELIFNDGNRLYRMNLSAKNAKHGKQKTKTSIIDVVNPDVY